MIGTIAGILLRRAEYDEALRILREAAVPDGGVVDEIWHAIHELTGAAPFDEA